MSNDFATALQRSVEQLGSVDTQRQGWDEMMACVSTLNAVTVPLFFKGLRRHGGSLQRASGRVLVCRAYAAAASVVPSLCARRQVLQSMLDGQFEMCGDPDSTVRTACAVAVAQTFHSVFPLVGASSTNSLNQTANLAATSSGELTSPSAFAQHALKRLTTLIQSPEPRGRHGAAAACLAVVAPAAAAKGADGGPPPAGAAVRVTGQSREIVAQQVPFLQRKLNQVCSLVHSLTHSLTHPLAHSFVRSVRPLVPLSHETFVQVPALTRSRTITHSPTPSPPPSYAHSPPRPTHPAGPAVPRRAPPCRRSPGSAARWAPRCATCGPRCSWTSPSTAPTGTPAAGRC
jgi:hypothetical protein